MGLVDSLHAFHWRFRLLRRGLYAHVPWSDLRLLPQATRTRLVVRLRHFLGLDGRGFHGLFAALAMPLSDDVCLSTDSIYNENWTGINHPIKDSLVISIYPNPSKGFLNVESPIPITNYSIYNIQGQLMNKVKVNTASSFEINLSDNLNGMYFLKITTQQGMIVKKIIKL